MQDEPPATVIEVFADVSCPFAHAGLHRWFTRRADLERPDVALRVRAWPLELVNGAPLLGSAIAPKVAALARTFPALFSGFDADSFPTSTLPALRLTDAAYARNVTVGELVATAVRHHLFVLGNDISDPGVLAEIATTHDVPMTNLDREHSVTHDLDEGRRRGVIGSPHFFGPGFDAFCPGLDIDHAGGRLSVAEAGATFDDFVERCFERT